MGGGWHLGKGKLDLFRCESSGLRGNAVLYTGGDKGWLRLCRSQSCCIWEAQQKRYGQVLESVYGLVEGVCANSWRVECSHWEIRTPWEIWGIKRWEKRNWRFGGVAVVLWYNPRHRLRFQVPDVCRTANGSLRYVVRLKERPVPSGRWRGYWFLSLRKKTLPQRSEPWDVLVAHTFRPLRWGQEGCSLTLILLFSIWLSSKSHFSCLVN